MPLAHRKKTIYFKLTLPNTGNELKVAVWVTWTPEQVLLYASTGILMRNQIGLDPIFANAEKAFETMILDPEITKGEYDA